MRICSSEWFKRVCSLSAFVRLPARKITYMHTHLQVVSHLSVHVCALCVLVRTRARVRMRIRGSKRSRRVCLTRLARTRKSRPGVRISVSFNVRACTPDRASSARMHAHLWCPSRLRLRVQRLPARVWTRLRSRARMRIYTRTPMYDLKRVTACLYVVCMHMRMQARTTSSRICNTVPQHIGTVKNEASYRCACIRAYTHDTHFVSYSSISTEKMRACMRICNARTMIYRI